MDTAISHPVPDRVKPSFVIFDSVRVPGCHKLISTNINASALTETVLINPGATAHYFFPITYTVHNAYVILPCVNRTLTSLYDENKVNKL